MPRSILTPRVGSLVWYYANAGAATAQAALVVNVTASPPAGQIQYDLVTWTALGVASFVAGVLFCDRSFQPTTAYCESIVADARLTGGSGPSQTMMTLAEHMMAPPQVSAAASAADNPAPSSKGKSKAHAA